MNPFAIGRRARHDLFKAQYVRPTRAEEPWEKYVKDLQNGEGSRGGRNGIAE